MLEQAVKVREFLVLVDADALRQDEDLASGSAGVVPAACLLISVVQDPSWLIEIGAEYVGNDPKINGMS